MRTATPLYKALASVGCILLATACQDDPVSPRAEPGARFEVGSQGGNSNVAKLCQQGGYLSLFRADGSAFATDGDCVSYGAHGGVFATYRTVTFSDITIGACNDVTFGYTIGGVSTDVYNKPYDCAAFHSYPDYVVQVLSTQTVQVYLRDNTCFGAVFTQDGAHALVTGTNPYQIAITDAGGFCESTSNSDARPPTNGIGNLNLTETVN